MLRKPWKHRPLVCSTVFVVAGLLALWKPIENEFWQLRVPATGSDHVRFYPVGAVDYLERTGFSGNVMVPFEQGSYLSWKLTPDVKVSVDSRYEVAYEPEWVERTLQFYEVGPDWKSVLDEYSTDAILVLTGSPLMKALEEQLADQWSKRYEDPGYSLFVATSNADRYPQEYREELPPGPFP